MKIIKMQNGSYGVEHDGKMIVENESMGVCDSVIFAHEMKKRGLFVDSEGMEIVENIND